MPIQSVETTRFEIIVPTEPFMSLSLKMGYIPTEEQLHDVITNYYQMITSDMIASIDVSIFEDELKRHV